jgi:hypothetical protein
MLTNFPNVGTAHVLISLSATGEATTRTYCFGKLDCYTAPKGDDQQIASEIPFLLAELRSQVALGRRLTVAESEALRGELNVAA